NKENIGFRLEEMESLPMVLSCLQRLLSIRGSSGKKKTYSSEIVQKVTEYIEVYYHMNLQVRTVSEAFHFSPNYLSQIFKHQTGMSFTDYVTRVRIQKAQELLIHSTLKIGEISERVGFQDVKY